MGSISIYQTMPLDRLDLVVIDEMRRIIAAPEHVAQGADTRFRSGEPTRGWAHGAYSYSVLGALGAVTSDAWVCDRISYHLAQALPNTCSHLPRTDPMSPSTCRCIVREFNDSHTHADVLAFLADVIRVEGVAR